MNRYVTLGLFIVLVLGGGLLIGSVTAPGASYQALEKSRFNPPNWLFGPAWSLLYVLIGIAGWRTWERKPGGRAMKLWWAQLALNFLWSPTFFALQSISSALVIIAILLATILGFVALTWNRDRIAALLFVPYALWVGFATALNASIRWLN